MFSWDHFEKFVFCQQGEDVFLRTLQKLFFLPISSKISIFKKISLWKNWFWHICQKILTFRENDVILSSLFLRSLWKNCFLAIYLYTIFLDHFENIVFCPYFQKYENFEENYVNLSSLWKKLFLAYTPKNINISRIIIEIENINISRKGMFSWEYFEKFMFCPYLGKYQHSRKTTLF